MSSEDAVVAMCGLSREEAAPVLSEGRAHRGAAGLDAAAAVALQAVGSGGGVRVATVQEAAAAEAEVFGVKGQQLNKDAGARWLTQVSVLRGPFLLLPSQTHNTGPTSVTTVTLLLAPHVRGTPPEGPSCSWRLPYLLTFLQWCGRVSGIFGEDALPTAVARLLLSGRSDDEVAAELFDMMGEGVFEHIGEWARPRKTTQTGRRMAERCTCKKRLERT